MKTEQNILSGDQTISRDLSFQGTIEGNVTVQEGIAFDHGGTITGDLHIAPGGICKLDGLVSGNVRNHGGVLRIRGRIKGDLHREAGSTEIDPQAVIEGQIH